MIRFFSTISSARITIAGTVAGVGLATGLLVGTGSLAGTAAGSSVSTANIVATGQLIGSTNGVGSATGILYGTGQLLGAVSGSSTSTGILFGTGELIGTTSGVGSATGNLVNVAPSGNLVGITAGVGEATGVLVGTGYLLGTSSGVGSATGILAGTGQLIGTTSGTSTTTGILVGDGQLIGTVSGSSTSTGILVGDGQLIGTTAGVGASTGILVGTGQLIGTTAGVGSATGNLVNAAGGYDSANALSFDGTNDYLAMAGDMGTVSDRDMLLSLWFNSNDFSAVQSLFEDNNSSTRYIRIENSTTIRVRLSTLRDFTVPTMSTNTWYHLVIHRYNVGGTSGAGTRVYLNGTESSSGEQNVGATNPTLDLIGGDRNFFNGELDDIVMWGGNRTLTTEVADLYNGGAGVDPTTVIASPAIWLKFDETGSATTAVNSGSDGTSFDGTLTNFPASGMWVAGFTT